MRKKLWSIFTGNMDKCIVTGMCTEIERHHVLEGMQGYKAKSEKYGFIAPLHRSVHPNGAFCTDENWSELDHWLKRMCQEYYMQHYGTRDDWYSEFGRFYDDREDENVWIREEFEFEELKDYN